MTQLETADTGDRPAKGLAARVVGVLVSPRDTYAAVAAHPRAFGVLMFTAALMAGVIYVFLSSELGQRVALDQQVKGVEAFGITVSDQMYAQMESRMAMGPSLTFARGEMAGANLGVFVPMLDETSLPARFLGAIDLFYVWWAVSLAIGLGVLYRRRTGGIASAFIGLYVLLALVLAVCGRKGS